MLFCVGRPWIKPSPVIFLSIPKRKFPANSFSSTAFRAALPNKGSKTYYEILNVPITATTQEIKKQFYALSLAHHPDTNPKDPNASDKFTSISSAYQVLSNVTKRARYDHDHNIHRPVATSGTHTSSSHRGSYVGSRPPSGLSKRRGPFKGPPPSFYAHGGYGENNQQQQQQQKQHQPGPSSSSEDHTSFIYRNTVPHFNASSHFQTQVHEDTRRRLRRSREFEAARTRAREEGADIGGYDGGSMTIRFLVVAGTLVVAMISASVGRSRSEVPYIPARSHASLKKDAVGSGDATSISRLERSREKERA